MSWLRTRRRDKTKEKIKALAHLSSSSLLTSSTMALFPYVRVLVHNNDILDGLLHAVLLLASSSKVVSDRFLDSYSANRCVRAAPIQRSQ